MDEDNEIDFEQARRDLEASINELRKLRGKKGIPYKKDNDQPIPPLCSFCRKGKNQVLKLIEGPNGVYICNECVVICYEIIEANNDSE